MTPDAIPGMTAAPDFSLVVLAVYMCAMLGVAIFALTALGVFTLPLFFGVLLGLEWVLVLAQNTGSFAVKMVLMMLRSLRRNLLRTALTYVALFVFTGVLTLIYSVIAFLGAVTAEKETDVKVIMTEKFQIPSTMPPGHVARMKAILENDLPPEARPKNIHDDLMRWSFVGGSLDPAKMTLDNSLFLFCMDPHSLLTMMDELGPNDMSAAEYQKFKDAVALMEQDRRNVIVGRDKLAQINKRVGDEFKISSMNYKDIEFEFKVVGVFPPGRYDGSAVMRADYLQAKLDDYQRQKGQPHVLADRCINLIWVRLPNKAAFEQLAAVVNEPGKLPPPAVKLETASAGIGAFLDAYKDIFFGIKFILMPTLAVLMGLVVAITLTISVRERWTEMAVLKVLGFQPRHVLTMILGEGLLIGVLGGGICTWALYWLFHFALPGGLKFPIAFFGAFHLTPSILWLGPLLGVVVSGIGSFIPAWSARGVKASNVFSQVA